MRLRCFDLSSATCAALGAVALILAAASTSFAVGTTTTTLQPPQGFCGDGVTQPDLGEQCDDANTNDFDACRNTCQFNVCGDGVQNVGVEQCDDGNTDNTDCCTNACNFAMCGDGIVQNCQLATAPNPPIGGGEQCDDGNTNDMDGCLTTCQFNVCGDGIQNVGVEQCDDGNTDDSDGCLSTCQLNVCGDGFRNIGVEQCDDGDTSNENCCTNACLTATCGDGFVQQCNNEECDDANSNETDGCTSLCRIAIPPTSTTTTTLPPTGACCAFFQCVITPATQCEFGYQGDGTNCDVPSICSVCGNGVIEAGEVCDDANTTAGDGCDGNCNVEQCWVCVANQVTTTTGPGFPPIQPGPSVCSPDNGASCDDGDLCTLGDSCSGGTCDGNAVVIPAACQWVMVGDTSVQSRTRGQTTVTGHVCGGRVRLGEFSSTNGDAVATLASGVGVQISPHADVTGDIISGGSAVRGKPRLTLLPGLTTDVVAGGTTAARTDHAGKIYDTLGTHARVADCAAAQGDVAAGDSLLAGLPPGPDLGDTFIPAGGGLTLTASNPGGLNVFDFRKLQSGMDATLTLDGAGNAGSVFVVRVSKKLDLRLRSEIVLAGSAVPGNVILYSQAKCRFGLEVVGVGTVFCPNGKLILEARTQWQGALVGGRGRVELRDSGVLTHVPLQVGP